jgi:hypothetical protein
MSAERRLRIIAILDFDIFYQLLLRSLAIGYLSISIADTLTPSCTDRRPNIVVELNRTRLAALAGYGPLRGYIGFPPPAVVENIGSQATSDRKKFLLRDLHICKW